MILHNDQGIQFKKKIEQLYIYMYQHRSTSIHKAKAKILKREINSNIIIVGALNTPHTPMENHPNKKSREKCKPKMTDLSLIDLRWSIRSDRLN